MELSNNDKILELVEWVARGLCEDTGDIWDDLAEKDGGMFPAKEDYIMSARRFLGNSDFPLALICRDRNHKLPTPKELCCHLVIPLAEALKEEK